MLPNDTAEADAIRRQAALFDTPGQAVIGTCLTGEIVYWSAAAARLYGWTAAEVRGRNIVDVTPSDLSRERAEGIMERLQHGQSWAGDFRVRTRSGEEFSALVRDLPVHGDMGQLVGVVGVSVRSESVPPRHARAFVGPSDT